MELDSQPNGNRVQEASLLGNGSDPPARLALAMAIHAFSARWLTLTAPDSGAAYSNEKLPCANEHHCRTLWHRARKAVCAHLTRPSYTAVLALHLVSITGAAIDHEETGIEDLCVETALLHTSKLWDNRSCATANVLPDGDAAVLGGNQDPARVAFRLGVFTDTAYAMTKRRPSILLPGNSGENKVWSQVRQRRELFDTSFRTLHSIVNPLATGVVEAILQHATACKSMCWWQVTRVQDVLFLHTTTQTVQQVVENAAREFKQHTEIFDPLLILLARDFMLLDHKYQLGYGNFHFVAFTLESTKS